ncbi:MAG: hypothetical protein KW788_04155 [Candidatus Doudnabacteria bacterium]|nr:hypothetical protein [Candidatus Doudnabacteria bacterium]
MKKVFGNIYLLWLILTGVFLISAFFLPVNLGITGLIGLLVPAGIISLLGAWSFVNFIITLPFLFIIFFAYKKFTQKTQDRVWILFLLNLLLLLVITFLIDIIFYHQWVSEYFFLNKQLPFYGWF